VTPKVGHVTPIEEMPRPLLPQPLVNQTLVAGRYPNAPSDWEGLWSQAATQPVLAQRRPVVVQTRHWRGTLLPMLSVIAALGLLVVGAADRLAGSGIGGMEPLFWVGLLLIVGPITARLLMARVAREERLGLIVVLSLGLYLVKVMQSPFGFTYSDEFVHLYNANQIMESGRLFAANPILPVSALYPGLEATTIALRQVAGLDVFSAGMIVVGLARLIMMVALFLLYEQVSGSARTASLASLLYTANSNFLFWSAQFSYESLALPLAVLALWAVARREAGKHPSERLGLTLTAMLLIGAVVVTHHLSSYFLATVLGLWAGLGWVREKLDQYLKDRHSEGAAKTVMKPPGMATGGPGGLALLAGVGAIFWLVFVASLTLHYLSPMFGKAVVSLLNQLVGEEPGRGLFHSTSESVAPVWERVVGISAVLLCLMGLPFGLWQVWRRYQRHPLALLLGGAAIAYFGLLGLRLVPSAWEISNRSSEYLFLGLAFVLAAGRLPRWLSKPLLVIVIGVIFAGGVVAGWSAELRVAQVYQVSAGAEQLEPAGQSAAEWVRTHLGPNQNFAADESNGRYLMAYGDQNALTGRNLNIKSIFETPDLKPWQTDLLYSAHIEYVAVDRRRLSGDNMRGYFFDRGSSWPLPDQLLVPTENYTKFDGLPGVSRILDSGDLVLYDIRRWIDGLPIP
jgi:hypothetical protein